MSSRIIPVRTETVKDFPFGTIDSVEDRAIPEGAASASLNWLTLGDRIELRRGLSLLGTENTGTGEIGNQGVAFKADGTQILYRKRGRKLEYYSTATSDWVEVGTNIFPLAATNDYMATANYASLAGNQFFICTPNAGPFKIMTANPGSYTDLTDTSKNFQGYMKIKQNRMILWHRIKDLTGIYGSYIDAAAYTTVTGEATASLGGTLKGKIPGVFTVTIASPAVFSLTAHGLIAGSAIQFSTTGALPTGLTAGTTYYVIASGLTANAFEVSTTPGGTVVNTSGSQSGTHTVTELTRTIFAVVIALTGTGEVYTDDFNGNLAGSLGGTGTINYTTGAYTLSAAGVGTAVYQWENSNNTGITDFTKSSPRTAGQGFVFRQDDGGGAAQNVLSYGDVEYCMHEYKTWALTLTADDTSATNLIYRDRVGIPNWQAACETGTGVYYIDYTDQSDPQIRALTLNQYGSEVVPVSISKAKKVAGELVGLDLTNYRFDKAVVREWGKYILTACRYKDSVKNDTLITYDKTNGALDKQDYSTSSLTIYNGTLTAGDSVSSNSYVLFSGFDDDDSLIDNSWEGALADQGTDYLKKTKKFVIQGRIQAAQSFDISLALDNGNYSLVGTINGNGSYVDAGNPYLVGTETLGSHVIGDGGDGVNAFNYEHVLKLRTDKYQRGKLRFKATGIGYLSINLYKWFDIRLYAKKTLTKYR